MTEIDKQKAGSAVSPNPAISGNVVALFETEFIPNQTPNTARDSGKTSLTVVSAGMTSRRVPKALKEGGQTSEEETLKGAFLQLIPADGQVGNILKEYPDGTRIHISEESGHDLLIDAPKPAVVNTKSKAVLSRREISRRIIINVFSTSADPSNYGIEDWFKRQEGEQTDTLVQSPASPQQPSIKERDKAA